MVQNTDEFDWAVAIESAMKRLENEEKTDPSHSEQMYTCDFCNFKSRILQEIEAHYTNAHKSMIFNDPISDVNDTSVSYQRVQDSQEDDVISEHLSGQNQLDGQKDHNQKKKNRQQSQKEMTIIANSKRLPAFRSSILEDSIDKNIKLEKYRGRFPCYKQNCTAIFGSQQILAVHINYKHKKRSNFICSTCGVVVKKYQHLVTHVKEAHVQSIKYKCKLCPASSFEKSDITEHLKDYHRIGVIVDGLKGYKPIDAAPNQCQGQNLSNAQCKDSEKNNVLQMFFKCKNLDCNYFAYEPSIVNLHFEKAHLLWNVEKDDKYKSCNRLSSSKIGMIKHYNIFHKKSIGLFKTGNYFHNKAEKNSTFDCRLCKGRYTSKDLFKIHQVKSHSRTRLKRKNTMKSNNKLSNSNILHKSNKTTYNLKTLHRNSTCDVSQETPEYELIRQRNIKKNQAALSKLGLM